MLSSANPLMQAATRLLPLWPPAAETKKRLFLDGCLQIEPWYGESRLVS